MKPRRRGTGSAGALRNDGTAGYFAIVKLKLPAVMKARESSL